MFSRARAAGLPMLGGIDYYVFFRGQHVRAHFWAAHHQVHDPDDAHDKPYFMNISKEDIENIPTIVILPGFTEFCEKYSLDILRFHKSGLNVMIIDWPGQGLSGHFGRHPLAVHCDRFSDYLDALDAVINAKGLSTNNLILFGHSMGGHLALRYAVRSPSNILGVILSSPMMAPPVMPVWLIRTVSTLLAKIGFSYFYPPFYNHLSLDQIRHYCPENPLTRCPKGYELQFIWLDDMPGLRRSGPTLGWVSEAYRSSALYTLNPDWLGSISIPVLALVAGDEQVVSAPATDFALTFIPDLERHDFEDARHELLRELPEVKNVIWEHINKFIDKIQGNYKDKFNTT